MKNPGKLRKWMIKKLGGYTFPVFELKTAPQKAARLRAIFTVFDGYEEYAEKNSKRILCEKLAEKLAESDAVEIYKTTSPGETTYNAVLTVVVPEGL